MRRSRRQPETGPAVSSETAADPCAASNQVGEPPPAPENPELQDLSEFLAAIPLDWDDWELDDDLRRAEGLTRNLSAAGDEHSRPAAALAAPRSPELRTQRAPRTNSGKLGIGVVFSWTALSLGLMALVCGVALVCWSYISGRGDLWRIGVPLALLGQSGWLVGLLLQFDELWQSHRSTSQALEDLQARCDALEEAAAWTCAPDFQTGLTFRPFPVSGIRSFAVPPWCPTWQSREAC
jgi:hypothetical protein